ncbi:MAG: hypothetical protein JSS72_12130 [Armatimonadetes bacterium]|nr:hypothetical protein [Armatimonadota bacterium]
MKHGAVFGLGLAIGVLSALLLRRLQDELNEENAQEIADKLTEQLQNLESRAVVESPRDAIRLAK